MKITPNDAYSGKSPLELLSELNAPVLKRNVAKVTHHLDSKASRLIKCCDRPPIVEIYHTTRMAQYYQLRLDKRSS